MICLFIHCNGRILLYDTENLKTLLDKFDCIYVRDDAQGRRSVAKPSEAHNIFYRPILLKHQAEYKPSIIEPQ